MSPWLALAAPLILFGLLAALNSLYPDLFCVAMNPGGKEFICGSRYTHIGIRLLQKTGLGVWVLLLIAGGAELFRRRATWPAALAWSVSALMLCSLVMLWLSLPANECP